MSSPEPCPPMQALDSALDEAIPQAASLRPHGYTVDTFQDGKKLGATGARVPGGSWKACMGSWRVESAGGVGGLSESGATYGCTMMVMIDDDSNYIEEEQEERQEEEAGQMSHRRETPGQGKAEEAQQ